MDIIAERTPLRRPSVRRTGPAACLALALALVGPGAAAETERYEIDEAHMAVAFLVDHIGYARTLGMFRKARGSYAYDPRTGELSELVVEIETESVFTNHRKRDEHLRGTDFLNSAEFPLMRFSAGPTLPEQPGGRRYLIEGELELLGRTQPVSLQATVNKIGEYPFGGGPFKANPHVMGVSAEGAFARSAFGMNYAVDNGWVGDEVELMIEFEARRQ